MLTANMKMIAECADKLAHLGEKLFNVTEMKYRAGNKVRIKSLDWYNENKGMNGLVGLFTPSMVKLCGMVVTLDTAYNGKYTAIEEEAKGYYLDDTMIEGLAEGLTQEEFAVEWANFDFNKSMNDVIRKRREENMKRDKLTTPTAEELRNTISEIAWHITGVYECPDGYEFKDEDGNVIEAKKIVLEKKKPKYPESYEECCQVLNIAVRDLEILDNMLDTTEIIYQKNLDRCINALRKLLICRDAYWKIAGEEMGLGKPWEPDWKDVDEKKWVISRYKGELDFGFNIEPCRIIAFPTEEMRDAFYENFKDLIEECKELL